MESIDKKEIAIIVMENLTKIGKMYKEKSCEFVNFLERTDTEESIKETLSHKLIVSTLESLSENIIEEINDVIFTSYPQIHDDKTSGKTPSKESIQK